MIVALATGSGRCGTQTFGAQMQRLKGVIGVHEGVRMTGHWGANRNLVPHLVCGDPAAEQWNRDALLARRRAFLVDGMTAYGEGAHYFALNLPLVEQVFPEARIVHLVRDPAQMVWSMMQHSGASKQDGKIYERGRHVHGGGRWTWWGDSFPNWPGVTNRAEGFATYWQRVNEAVERTSLPRLLVRTEDLRSADTWARILDFLGLGHLRVEAPALVFNARHPKRKPPVTRDVVEVVKRICTWIPK